LIRTAILIHVRGFALAEREQLRLSDLHRRDLLS